MVIEALRVEIENMSQFKNVGKSAENLKTFFKFNSAFIYFSRNARKIKLSWESSSTPFGKNHH